MIKLTPPPRPHIVQTSLSQAEFDELQRARRGLGLSQSGFIREAIARAAELLGAKEKVRAV